MERIIIKMSEGNEYRWTSLAIVEIADGYIIRRKAYKAGGLFDELDCQSSYIPAIKAWDLYNAALDYWYSQGTPEESRFYTNLDESFKKIVGSGLVWYTDQKECLLNRGTGCLSF